MRYAVSMHVRGGGGASGSVGGDLCDWPTDTGVHVENCLCAVVQVNSVASDSIECSCDPARVTALHHSCEKCVFCVNVRVFLSPSQAAEAGVQAGGGWRNAQTGMQFLIATKTEAITY